MTNIEKITHSVLAFKPHMEEEGRPIRLADVIRAGAGSLAPEPYDEFIMTTVEAWDLDHDDLSKLSEPRLATIAALLP